MIIEYIKVMQKWLVSYKGKPVGVGETIPEALQNALLAVEL